MDLDRPRFVEREELFARRFERAASVRFVGLWVAGALDALERPTVAVVGPRAPSAGGLARARGLATGLSRAGVCVISGFALGIDGAAHAGALAGPTPTIGVLGGGHRCFFPRRHRELAERAIAHGGAAISPFPPDEPARPAQFLQRNGVVAALADAVVVVEAAARSGALNTASWAAALSVDVLAYPGDVDRALAAGTNALIRDGATLVRDAADVLEALGIPAHAAGASADAADGSGEGRVADDVLRALAAGPAHPESLAARTSAAIGDVLAALVRLELAGRVERRDGQHYARVPADGSTARARGRPNAASRTTPA